MTAADKLRAEGRLEGRQEGERIGKLQLLEQLMGAPISPSENLAGLSLAELKGRFADLHLRYEARFKARQSPEAAA